MLKRVQTKYGTLEGVTVNDRCVVFKGIPYAAPPVGNLRFREPIDPEPWEGVRICDRWGKACPQHSTNFPNTPYGVEFYTDDNEYWPGMDEDCLFMNIWTPAESGGDKLPVMMWIHGGGVQNGWGSEKEFDGEALASRGVIVITINYRLNIFGFFAHPELTAESGHNASGNYGIMDQIQALKWIHENISAFGGDPERVMVFGQSGGGRSTQSLACSPLTKGLLHRVAIHSAGGILTGFGRLYREELEKRGEAFLEMYGIRDVEELRCIHWERLNEMFLDYSQKTGMWGGFNICADGYVLPETMEDTILRGHHSDIDYIAGCTIKELYGLKGEITNPMGASVRGMARVNFEQGRKPMYMYCFERKLPGVRENAFIDEAFHSSELWFVHGTMERCWRPFTEADYQLSSQMMDYWTNFAKTGDPNGEGLPEWKPFQGPDYLEMALSTEGCIMKDYYDAEGHLREQEDELIALGEESKA